MRCLPCHLSLLGLWTVRSAPGLSGLSSAMADYSNMSERCSKRPPRGSTYPNPAPTMFQEEPCRPTMQYNRLQLWKMFSITRTLIPAFISLNFSLPVSPCVPNSVMAISAKE
uniref:Secreted protein n=1 Tax=Eutreptiella gymnastica TaxID=73025 RepID=A0A7S1HUB3_9EUGL